MSPPKADKNLCFYKAYSSFKAGMQNTIINVAKKRHPVLQQPQFLYDEDACQHIILLFNKTVIYYFLSVLLMKISTY